MSHVYPLNGEFSERSELGNKGANLVAMTGLGLPVPPGFVVPIKAYERWRETGALPDEAIGEAMASLEVEMGRRLGQGLEVSVRSSAPVSMPGMMDTILNIGDAAHVRSAVKRIFESWDNPRAVEYRRLNGIPPTLGTAAVVQAMVY
ncbi:MAG: PEP/pyruvate-binding domain-containing protein, partial [Chloroflexota bacterium]|nr:PEP/pyruvate-binding domain-containing protein [Chloroflexota bacterium]